MVRTHDDKADRQLRLFVGLVVVGACIPTLWSMNRILSRWHAADLRYLSVTVVIALANLMRTQVRIRATTHIFTPTSAAILVGMVFVPPEWIIMATIVAMLTDRLTKRVERIKVAFNTAKDVLSVAAAAAVATLIGFATSHLNDPQPKIFADNLPPLICAAIAYAIVDETLVSVVLAKASRTSVRQRLLHNWDIRGFGHVGCLAIAAMTMWMYSLQPWLLAALPPLLYAMHLTSANRVRARAEREAWQRLSRATDEFNVVEFESVVRTAVPRATELFSADEVDLVLYTGGAPRRLLRGESAGISYDGPMSNAPFASGYAIPVPLREGGEAEGGTGIGELVLRFRAPVKLSEREQYALRTFTASLCTAIRNACTFAETKRLAEHHARASAHDQLTGLANRTGLHEYGAKTLAADRTAGRTGLLLIDLNHFKEVNDALGHSAGDQVLVEAARRLSAATEEGDLVARLGGDEFAVLFVNLPTPAAAVSRAHAVLASLIPAMQLENMRISIEASGGVTTTTDGDFAEQPDQPVGGNGGPDPVAPVSGAGPGQPQGVPPVVPRNSGISELLRRADLAMYHAKREGRRVSVYDADRDTADVGSLALGGDLARAIAERQFVLKFQPIVDLGSGKVIAAEALTRWQHPDRGYLPPAMFLDAIERSGQLPAFADAVLDQALAAAGSWADAGFQLDVAVNVSPRSLLDPSFPESVATALARHSYPPENLVLELTETVTLSKLEVVDEVLTALRGIGARLALDDFGTGYSSLATVARVPVYELKIDRGFVATMDEPAAAAVVRSTIELGRLLDLVVVAEGVETEEQRNRLWELGCPAGQGHLFARPIPAEQLLSRLESGCEGRRQTLVPPIHEAGSVIRMPAPRRGRQGTARFDQPG